jgi:hypothetical protein
MIVKADEIKRNLPLLMTVISFIYKASDGLI